MKHGKVCLFVCGVLGLVVGAKAIVNDAGNPYQQIVERNVFGLKDPPPQVVEPPPKPPSAKITMTGITTILGRSQVLLEWMDPPVPGQPPAAKKNYAILTEGQREGQIEVLEINPTAGSAKIKNSGETITLTFEQNGSKLASVPYTAPSLGAGGMSLPAGSMGVPPPGHPPAAGGGGMVTINGAASIRNSGSETGQLPMRPMRLSNQSVVQQPGQLQLPGQIVQTSPSVQTTQPAQPAQPPAPMLTREEQELYIDVMHEAHKGDPSFPPLPPTQSDPTRNVAPQQPPTPPSLPQ